MEWLIYVSGIQNKQSQKKSSEYSMSVLSKQNDSRFAFKR